MPTSSELDAGVKVKRWCGDTRIGELATQAGASPRQVRFYEAKRLITSTRGPNNYRDYSEATPGRVQQIRDLLNAGPSTRAIRGILPCLKSPRDPIVFEGVTRRRWRHSNANVTG
ncbi:MerR family transcriptional regulator [Streptomyces sp. ActVer]|uniref:MerR family transcriptional regulator n=1 Tax=Streptomyces sp. ActVer TaxID=3014558 RepID=UPI002F96A677